MINTRPLLARWATSEMTWRFVRFEEVKTTPHGVRFTPTCVGKTVTRSPNSPYPPVHPHMRGEHFLNRPPFFDLCGSPPHAWGRRFDSSPCAAWQRFTPTCVGKTLRDSSRRRRARFTPTCVGKTGLKCDEDMMTTVHPHMRGEDTSASFDCSCRRGSPPHAWGRLARRRATLGLCRFTPTCVGKTSTVALGISLPSVHPHMRGEDVLVCFFDETVVRFTPTCVGKTRDLPTFGPVRPVHPHMRGEDIWTRWPLTTFCGSPPHAWGRLRAARCLATGPRFTPTCVGKTAGFGGGLCSSTVHPHMRGEDSSFSIR